MRKEAKALLGRHNFVSFAASGGKARDPLKDIKRINLSDRGHYINIEIEADGFLYNMVRNIVGTLIEIGRGRFPAGSMRKILEGRDRKLGGATAPARGLCLVKVRY
jgi:tRNA pseudouridine38-40 synthase